MKAVIVQLAEGKEDVHSSTAAIGRLNALETQVTDLYDNIQRLPSHEDWEHYRSAVPFDFAVVCMDG